MYIMCIILCLFSALSRRVGALQIPIIIYYLFCSLVRKFDHTLVHSCNAHKDGSELSYSSFLLFSEFDNFSLRDFCSKLKNKVENVSLWCAGVEKLDQSPSGQKERPMDSPLRTPPKVTKEVSKSSRFTESRILSYKPQATRAATDGPELTFMEHYGEPRHDKGTPQGCRRCGRDIADKLKEFGVGEKGESKLMWLVRHAVMQSLCAYGRMLPY